MPSSCARAAAALVLFLAAACAARIDPATVVDAQTVARVKSALVNDTEVGVLPIEVRVVNGIATLTGRVPSDALAARAVDLARAVPGVSRVESELRIGGEPAPAPPGGSGMDPADGFGEEFDLLGPGADRRLLAVGASIGWNGPNANRLDASTTIGPLVRVGAGQGLGLSIGFGWYGAELRDDGSEARIGRVRMRPVMAGIGYTFARDNASMALSAVAGIAFNSVDPHERPTEGVVALDVGNSLAWRPGVSLWFETSARTALNVSAGYVMTRPRLTVLDQGVVVRRQMTADALLVRVGLAYKIF